MNCILERIESYRDCTHSAVLSYTSDGVASLSYTELIRLSDSIASHILNTVFASAKPILVFGHKEVTFVPALLGILKSGHAYCPIDTNLPASRIESIIAQVEPDLIITCTTANFKTSATIMDLSDWTILNNLASSPILPNLRKHWLCGDKPAYIIFTSGSSGSPKGVTVSYRNLTNFCNWAETFFAHQKHLKFLNQAPFSFDLSVMDLYSSLVSGGTLCCLSKDLQLDAQSLSTTLKTADVDFWVSTPSFANLCLADSEFTAQNHPSLKTFWFCGETLATTTARALKERFPSAKIFNTYGPTESTVAVTSIEITSEVLATYDPLPIGKPKAGTIIYLEDDEIVIAGDTVALGYYNAPALTSGVFGKRDGSPAYRTGDKGSFKDEMLFFHGRLDLQIKLHGYRIELGDIENNLNSLPNISSSAVLAHADTTGEYDYLVAFIVTTTPVIAKLDAIRQIKNALRSTLPEYMIPKKLVFVDNLPLSPNGKIDRKSLGDKL